MPDTFLQVTSFDPLQITGGGAHVVSGAINGSNHLILTMSDGSTIDCGVLPSGGGSGTVQSIAAGDATVTVNNADPANPTVRVTSGTFDGSGAAASAQAFAIQRANHTGTQTMSTISDAGTSATKNIGTTTGTVAAGDDARLAAAASVAGIYFSANYR